MSVCATCGGSGIYGEQTSDARTFADGTRVESSGYITHLCDCRAQLPARVGRAQWWSLRPVYRADVSVPIGCESVSISVDTEMPISAENYPVVTRGNRYYPTLIEIEVSGDALTLHADTAREIAQRLIAAADAADACDLPDTDACGHWAPCECGQPGRC